MESRRAQAKIYSFCIRAGISFNWIFAGEHASERASKRELCMILLLDTDLSMQIFFLMFLRSSLWEEGGGSGFIDLRGSV